MRLPPPRGPISNRITQLLRGRVPSTVDERLLDRDITATGDPLIDPDFQLALACLYELHYRGFEDVDERLEWDPSVLTIRGGLEARFEAALCAAVPTAPYQVPVEVALRGLVDRDDSPSLSSYLMRHATVRQYRTFLMQRSVYHLKEADPHTWVIPRLHGAAKAALVEIQADEYGGGRAHRMHSALFAQTLRAVGLDDTYGAYWTTATAETFATVNLMSLFGLHRRHRGAAVGHLAALEMTSTTPNRRYANGLRRLGFGSDATAFFDEHVEADAVHEQLAAVDLCGGFVAAEPGREADVVWGAACCLALDAAAGLALIERFEGEQQSGVA